MTSTPLHSLLLGHTPYRLPDRNVKDILYDTRGDGYDDLLNLVDEVRELREFSALLLMVIDKLTNGDFEDPKVLKFHPWEKGNEGVLEFLHEESHPHEVIDIYGEKAIITKRETAMLLLMTFSCLKILM